jgi:hypothetical protein
MNLEKIKEALKKFVEKIIWILEIIKKYHDAFEIVLIGISLYVGYILYKETKEQVRIAHNALEYQRINDSINDVYQWKRDSLTYMRTDSTLTLTRKNNESFEQFSKIQSRAYILISEPRLTQFVAGQETIFEYETVNSGNTPAKQLRQECQIIYYNHDPFSANYDSTFAALNETGVMVVNAHDHTHVKVGGMGGLNILTQKYYESVMSNERVLYIIGRITYKDIFMAPHFTDFCLVYHPEANVLTHYLKFNNFN